jgi:hypothetical protein
MSVGNDFIAQPVPEPSVVISLALCMLTVAPMVRNHSRDVARAA